jgi:hypothetical protein
MSQIRIKQVAGLQAVLDQIDARLESGSLKSTYTQVGHGFSAGVAIAFLNGSWVLADAAAADKLGRLIIESVTTDTFVAVQIGNIEVSGWSLTPGKFYVVDDSGNGTMVEHVSSDNPNYTYSNPVLQALTTTTAQVLPWRPSLGAEPLAQGIEITQADLIPLETNGDGSPTGITLDFNPFSDSGVQVFLNGIAVTESYGDKTGDVYFSNDGGTTPKSIIDLDAGDELYWNANVTGYNIGSGDLIDMVYEKNSLD